MVFKLRSVVGVSGYSFRARDIAPRSQCGVPLIHQDGRNRLSNFWIPTGGIAPKPGDEDDVNSLLIRAGYLRQPYPGIFHLLPLGLRVQEKLEKLVDKHMRSIGASKVSLSSLSYQELWERSGRLKSGSELFKFSDRRESRMLLSPTHEEEITTLVRGLLRSWKDLPLRLYQVSRKYRDELRPRQGLLRGREFLMKDLYTFDYNKSDALKTYNEARRAYDRFFDELKLPFLVAKADSGNMGGNLSHEYQFPSLKGEDTVISCSKCDFAQNEELVEDLASVPEALVQLEDLKLVERPQELIPLIQWTGITKDKRCLVKAFAPASFEGHPILSPGSRQINPYALKAVIPDLDLRIENPLEHFHSALSSSKDQATRQPGKVAIRYIMDRHMPSDQMLLPLQEDLDFLIEYDLAVTVVSSTHDESLSLTRVKTGDRCERCNEGMLTAQKTIELGHTFFLGTRYSRSLEATVPVSKHKSPQLDSTGLRDEERLPHDSSAVMVQMGCHGIGLSRMIPTVADALSDRNGLNWPRVIAPFDVVIVFQEGLEDDATMIYDALVSETSLDADAEASLRQNTSIDPILDDRDHHLPWKLKDADLVGFPIAIVVGRSWVQKKQLEVQCRRLSAVEFVTLDELRSTVASLLGKL